MNRLSGSISPRRCLCSCWPAFRSYGRSKASLLLVNTSTRPRKDASRNPKSKDAPMNRATVAGGEALVLQLRFSLTPVVSGGGLGLVLSSPERPGHDEAGSDRGPEQETGQKIADLRRRRQKCCQAHQAAAGTAGLLSFALAHVARRRSAANRARKAAAARHRLMCRCHPCQERASPWSRPRSSLARSKHSSIAQRSPAAPASSPSETPTGAKAK